MCQAALPQHWLDSAPTPADRTRRKAALDALAVDRDGYRVYDGPAVLDLIRRWDRRFQWAPSEDRGIVVIAEDGRLVEVSALARRLLGR